MDDRGDWVTGLRMVIAASVSAVLVAAIVIGVGRAIITQPEAQSPSAAPTLVLVSR